MHSIHFKFIIIIPFVINVHSKKAPLLQKSELASSASSKLQRVCNTWLCSLYNHVTHKLFSAVHSVENIKKHGLFLYFTVGNDRMEHLVDPDLGVSICRTRIWISALAAVKLRCKLTINVPASHAISVITYLCQNDCSNRSIAILKHLRPFRGNMSKLDPYLYVKEGHCPGVPTVSLFILSLETWHQIGPRPTFMRYINQQCCNCYYQLHQVRLVFHSIALILP